jgi:hypothetical protein
MEYAYARTASDLEVKMWIKYNFQDYNKKKNNVDLDILNESP